MKSVAESAAEEATFRSFANCYRREIDPGRLVQHEDFPARADSLEWLLAGERMILRAEITSPSQCGPHRFGRIWQRRLSEAAWHDCPPINAVQALMREAYETYRVRGFDNLQGCETELLLRVIDSNQQIATNIQHAFEKPDDRDEFISAEQSLIFGHWLHPTPKSRQGMTFWQQDTYAPEFHGRFQLHYFAADRRLVTQASAGSDGVESIVANLLGSEASDLRLQDGEALLPMHPLQAQALLLDTDIAGLVSDGLLRSLGPAGRHFTATSSVRTVWSEDSDWMVKFSLPVRITNSVRCNGRDELEAGVAIAKLIDNLKLQDRLSPFRIIKDPAFITLDLPQRKESGFETIFRENPFRAESRSGAVTLAALTAEPLPGERSRLHRIIERLHLSEPGSLRSTATKWFRNYLACAVAPVISLYDDYGIALEAHQQNSLLDIRNGYPSLGFYRDNQGFYLSERHRSEIAASVPETEFIPSLYFPEADIRDRFAYYLIVNQVFSVISRMTHDGLADEHYLLCLLRDDLETLARSMTGLGREFVRHILDEDMIGTKANLATRLADIDELSSVSGYSLYRTMPNPLRNGVTARVEMERQHAIAS